MIDSAQDIVGTFLHQRLDGQHDAVGRRSVDLPFAIAAPYRTNRMVQRERMARSALLPIGRDDDDLTQRLGRFLQTLEAVRENTVVVGEQEAHQRARSRASFEASK